MVNLLLEDRNDQIDLQIKAFAQVDYWKARAEKAEARVSVLSSTLGNACNVSEVWAALGSGGHHDEWAAVDLDAAKARIASWRDVLITSDKS